MARKRIFKWHFFYSQTKRQAKHIEVYGFGRRKKKSRRDMLWKRLSEKSTRVARFVNFDASFSGIATKFHLKIYLRNLMFCKVSNTLRKLENSSEMRESSRRWQWIDVWRVSGGSSLGIRGWTTHRYLGIAVCSRYI